MRLDNLRARWNSLASAMQCGLSATLASYVVKREFLFQRKAKVMADHMRELNRLRLEHGFDELTAWRHMRDREILRRQYAYQQKGNYRG